MATASIEQTQTYSAIGKMKLLSSCFIASKLGGCSQQVRLPVGLLQTTRRPKSFKALDLTVTWGEGLLLLSYKEGVKTEGLESL